MALLVAEVVMVSKKELKNKNKKTELEYEKGLACKVEQLLFCNIINGLEITKFKTLHLRMVYGIGLLRTVANMIIMLT